MSRGAWWATGHGSTKSQTWLSILWRERRWYISKAWASMCMIERGAKYFVFQVQRKNLSSTDQRDGGWRLVRGVVKVKTQVCPTLWDPVYYSLPCSSVHEILQARILEGVAISFSKGLPNPGIKPESAVLQADSLQADWNWGVKFSVLKMVR